MIINKVRLNRKVVFNLRFLFVVLIVDKPCTGTTLPIDTNNIKI